MLAPVCESESGPRDQASDGRRDENLTGAGKSSNARCCVNRDASNGVPDQFALAGMDAGAHLDSKPTQSVNDRGGAADRSRGPVEDGKESVAGSVDLAPAVLGQLGAHKGVMLVNERAPGTVAQLRRSLGGPNDVGHEDGRQDAVSYGSSWRPG